MSMTLMTIPELLDEWWKGCSDAGPASGQPLQSPAHCIECTEALIIAIQHAHEQLDFVHGDLCDVANGIRHEPGREMDGLADRLEEIADRHFNRAKPAEPETGGPIKTDQPDIDFSENPASVMRRMIEASGYVLPDWQIKLMDDLEEYCNIDAMMSDGGTIQITLDDEPLSGLGPLATITLDEVKKAADRLLRENRIAEITPPLDVIHAEQARREAEREAQPEDDGFVTVGRHDNLKALSGDDGIVEWPDQPRFVIIESPYAGDTQRNIEYIRAAVSDSLKRGEYPIASHLLYTQPGILDDNDPAQRRQGILSGMAWRERADRAVFYVDLGWSEGMKVAQQTYAIEGFPYEQRSIEWGV